jgi:hypothetical protein
MMTRTRTKYKYGIIKMLNKKLEALKYQAISELSISMRNQNTAAT